MDRLARNAMLARQANMSYGKWKAMQPREEPKKVDEDVLPEWFRECKECGKPFKPRGKQIFCEYYCRQKNWDRTRAREYTRKCRERKKAKENAG